MFLTGLGALAQETSWAWCFLQMLYDLSGASELTGEGAVGAVHNRHAWRIPGTGTQQCPWNGEFGFRRSWCCS